MSEVFASGPSLQQKFKYNVLKKKKKSSKKISSLQQRYSVTADFVIM